jgi:3-oxoacyl-[acyl-carrier protein] reductase
MNHWGSLNERVAIVTGAAQGIGKAIALCLARRGAAVLLADRDLLRAEVAASEIAVMTSAAAGRAAGCCVDVVKMSDVQAMVEQALSLWGRVDILVNNAGITRDTLLMRMKEEDWDAVLSVNLKGTFNGMKAVLPLLSKQRHGRIVNLSSTVGASGNVGQANYAASKAAVVGLTKTAAREYAGRGITINAVAPGFIETAMTAVLSPAIRENVIRQIPMGRFGSVDHIADAVAFLCSDEAGYITGQVLHVNGGLHMAS